MSNQSVTRDPIEHVSDHQDPVVPVDAPATDQPGGARKELELSGLSERSIAASAAVVFVTAFFVIWWFIELV